ncbi:MAG TPA: hypothetical protein VHV32_18995 [Candidatus Angelobacter sp.]|jgi:hypothetical protein|nr:hypothetical protein [Candidatus Angelobacter sp.]
MPDEAKSVVTITETIYFLADGSAWKYDTNEGWVRMPLQLVRRVEDDALSGRSAE